MRTTRLSGEPPVDILLRRTSQARRMTLRVSSLDGRVTLTVPLHIAERTALAFAGEHRAWIEQAQAGAGDVRRIEAGAVIPIEGRPTTVALQDRAGPDLVGGTLFLPEHSPGCSATVFLKLLARDRLATACDLYSEKLDRSYRALKLRDARSRWGSCSPDGRLMFSWRLAMAPGEILDYVAAHEVAHLVRMDHSPAFWDVVESICPDWRIHRTWLRGAGAELHRIRFED